MSCSNISMYCPYTPPKAKPCGYSELSTPPPRAYPFFESDYINDPNTNTCFPVYSQTYFDFNYPDLAAWTKRIPNAPRACFVTFGPGLSYFGCAQGHGSVWAGVSSELTDKVQKAYDTPSSAALGVNSAWFVMWPDGYFAWKFYGAYEGLDKELKGAEPRSVAVSSFQAQPVNPECGRLGRAGSRQKR